jgi:hypothetical protein
MLVLLSCVIAMSCGKSSPTSPDTPAPSGGGGTGGGGTAGGGTSGGGGTGATAIASDNVFDDPDWETEVQSFGAGGTGSGSHLHYLGKADGDYRRVTITANSAEGGSPNQVAVFSIKRGATYFPTSDGAIYTINYSEDSILFVGGGNGQYSAPALKQNGKLYTLVPGGGAFSTPEMAWTPHSLNGLRQNDFRTLASASEHPDFSATGSRIEPGFMRMHSIPAGSPGGTQTGGIDNWRLTFVR